LRSGGLLSRILVIRGGALGDFILTLPAIRLLRDSFPAAHLEILGYPHIASLAELSGWADATRSIEYGPLSGFFTPNGELATDLVRYFAGFEQIVSYLFDPDQVFATNLRRAGVRRLIVGSSKMNDQEHAARQLARPLEQLALYLEAPAAIVRLDEARKIDRQRIAIHPGSGSSRKNWPPERLIALARWLLAEECGLRLLLVGGEADEEVLSQMARSLPRERVELARDLPLPALANQLQNCALFVGHDSGVSHLAAAVGTPSLLLFGPTDPAVWAPQNPQVRILRTSDLTMAGIAVKEVTAALIDLRRSLPPYDQPGQGPELLRN
jgi:heptosyltransferase-2